MTPFGFARVDAVALALLALILAMIGIGERSLAYDEATSVLYAGLPLSEFLHQLAADPNMSLYYAGLKIWVWVFGESEVMVRAPSAIFAALATASLYHLGARLFGRTAGILAGLFLSLNPFIIQFAQTTRSYALVAFLVTLSSYLFVQELERSSRHGRLAYTIVSALAIYAHYLAACVLVVHGLTLLAVKRREALTRWWLTTAVAIALLVLPAAILASRVGSSHLGWILPPTLTDLYEVPRVMAGGSLTVLVLWLAGGSFALWAARGDARWWANGFVAAWMLVPVALVLLLSLVQPTFVPYYLIFVVPALALFGASTVTCLRAPLIAVYALPILGISIMQLTAFNPPERAENWRDATRYVLSAARPDDGLTFFPPGSRKPFEYYERRQAGPVRPRRLSADNTRMWLVIRDSDVPGGRADFDEARSSLAERYVLVERRQFRRVTVELYQR